MTKEEYQEKSEDLKNALNDLKREYIDANKEFDVGQKIIVRRKGVDKIGFVSKVRIGYGGDIIYDCVNCKKDGTHSLQSLPVWYGSEIIPFDEYEKSK